MILGRGTGVLIRETFQEFVAEFGVDWLRGKKKDAPDEETKGKPGQEHIVEGTIVEVLGDFILMSPQRRQAFLRLHLHKGALQRVVRDFYRRNPKFRDTYEKYLIQLPWWALCDGLGARTRQAPPPPPPQQGQQPSKKNAGQTPNQAKPQGGLDSENVMMATLFKFCLGVQAQERDEEARLKGRKRPEAAGDKFIIETIERMRHASPFEKGKEALEKGGKNAGEFFDGFLDEF